MSKFCGYLLLVLTGFASTIQAQDYSEIFFRHFANLVKQGTDTYGKHNTPVWMSSLDPVTLTYPQDPTRPNEIPSRVYLNRSVDAPFGASLYWDFPNIAAALTLDDIKGKRSFREPAVDYIRFFLDQCTATNGTFLYGNHYYYQAFEDQCVRFQSRELPVAVDFNIEQGELHEIRPFAPPWSLLWEIDSVATLKNLKTIVANHMADLETGEFNRHADGARGYAFIEQGGILVYSLAFLFQKTGNNAYLQQAQSIIDYSYRHRDPDTDLMANCPTQDRWDRHTSTTEVGHWAGYILKASEMVTPPYSDNWRSIIDQVIAKWLTYGFDETTGQFYGGLDLDTADPYKPAQAYPYQPGLYADIWNPLFPTHDYPMQMAETCLALYRLTGKAVYHQACKQWWLHIEKQVKNRDANQLLYAESYARIIHFLLEYQLAFKFDPARKMAQRLAREAIDQFYLEDSGMLRSHTGENRYDTVDGVGLLTLSLLRLQTGTIGLFNHYFF